MYRFIALIALFRLISAGLLPDNDALLYGNIIDGADTTISQYPYQVSLNWGTSTHVCSGSLLNKNTIVTAAHCFKGMGYGPFFVLAGTTRYDGLVYVKRLPIRAYKLHNDYNPTTLMNDIAVVKLAYPVELSAKVSFIELAEEAPVNGTLIKTAGWDGISCVYCQKTKFKLQEMSVMVLSGEECASDKYAYGEEIKEHMFCAQAVSDGACLRDGGSPLVVDNKLTGVMSWARTCAKPGYPVVYSDVVAAREWILETAACL